ncbi:MAG: hypothetical protein JXB33_01815 [Clostridia bacterium]|nr:hypothetical protein [Clostridia bacterium]
MKIIGKIMAILLVVVLAVPVLAFAEETEPITEETTEVDSIFDEILGFIGEDSPLYPVRELMYGISIEFVSDGEGNSKLSATFVNPLFFDREILSPEVLSELEDILVAKISAYLSGSEVIPAVLPVDEPDNVPIVEAEEENAVLLLEIPIGSGLSEEQSDYIVAMAVKEFSKTFITEAFVIIKENFFLSKEDLINSIEAYKTARKSGTDEEIQVAFETFMAAEENKDFMEALKDAVDLLKEEIKELLGITEDEDQEVNGPKEESPSIMNKLESNGIGKGLVKEKANNGKSGK